MRFRDHRAATTSVLSANRDLKALKACLAWAWMNELPHPQVPLRRLLLPAPPRQDRTLTPDEVHRVLEAAAAEARVLVILRIAYETGLRLGEILALTWADVDVAEGSISVAPKPWWEPKTAAAVRTVFAPDLVRWLDTYRSTLRHRGDDDRVCQMDPRRGKPWTHRVHEVLRGVYDRVGIEGKSPTHSLRHTVASEMVQAGVPIHVTQKHLGHSSPAVTLGIYAHAQRDGLRAAAEALGEQRRRDRMRVVR
jgi:integrase